MNQWYWPQKIEANRQRDADTTRRLREVGWEVVRVWEHESPELSADIIEALVRARKRRPR